MNGEDEEETSLTSRKEEILSGNSSSSTHPKDLNEKYIILYVFQKYGWHSEGSKEQSEGWYCHLSTGPDRQGDLLLLLLLTCTRLSEASLVSRSPAPWSPAH